MARCTKFYELCSYIYTGKKSERIVTRLFIYSCINTTMLGKNPHQSSVRSKNKQAFLLLRRRQCTNIHLSSQCTVQSYFFRLQIPLDLILGLQAVCFVS